MPAASVVNVLLFLGDLLVSRIKKMLCFLLFCAPPAPFAGAPRRAPSWNETDVAHLACPMHRQQNAPMLSRSYPLPRQLQPVRQKTGHSSPVHAVFQSSTVTYGTNLGSTRDNHPAIGPLTQNTEFPTPPRHSCPSHTPRAREASISATKCEKAVREQPLKSA
jgi:hypothetical protein